MNIKVTHERIWVNIISILEQKLPNWPQRVDALGQVRACQNRLEGHQWTDQEALKGLVYGLLSSNTKWEVVEPILPDLNKILLEYNINILKSKSPEWIDSEIYPWFLSRKAGSSTLKASLKYLLQTCITLDRLIQKHGSLEKWLQLEFQQGGAKQVVIAIGKENSPSKLKGFGIPLAAEAAKNLGFSIAKPDRHLNRMMANWGLVKFQRWNPINDFDSPIDCSEAELLSVVDVCNHMAVNLGLTSVYLDNVLWLAAASNGLHLNNQQLQAMLNN